MKALSFIGGIYGTTGVIVDTANIFGKRALKKKSQARTGAWETHELLCWKYLAEVTKSL